MSFLIRGFMDNLIFLHAKLEVKMCLIYSNIFGQIEGETYYFKI